ncbi:MAG TPA: hypothetical protein VG013_18540 [Gemmataceae bacterium]|jgi:hypothetical protein|nr:hypothetical protein [Gemmataceae bacterium]
MHKDDYYIISENSEDRLDSTDSLQDALRLARDLAREGQAGDAISIEHRGKVIRQLVRMPDGRVAEEEIR